MQQESKKLSIIVPVYNTEEYLEKCIDSLLHQSYKNIEVIIVNDASKGICKEIISKYKDDERIKYVEHDINKGLFIARVTGFENSTGEYIAFLDSDDYVTVDFYRPLIEKAEENKSDICIGNTILAYDDGRKMIYNLFETAIPNELIGENCLKEYFRQEGLCFEWHTIWNKIYSRRIWNKAIDYFKQQKKHLIMTEDFAFSTVLFYYANKLTRIDNDGIFYCKHENTSTDVKDFDKQKFMKNLDDLILSFEFSENFIKSKGIYEKYRTNINRWKLCFFKEWEKHINNSELSVNDKEEVRNKLFNFYNGEKEKIESQYFFYSLETTWKDDLEKIKEKICDKKTKYVSFDVFDTLVTRPFLEPVDLFKILDEYFRKITNIKIGVDFSKIRETSERLTREMQFKETPNLQEVTLDEIYDNIQREYKIDKCILDKMKQKEIEYEIRFCSQRKTTYELYRLAKSMGKRVICISDMYLSKDVISQILEKNNYNEFYELYVSSEYKVTKYRGILYEYVLQKLEISPDEMVHIGDNYESDVLKSRNLGINGMYLPRTINTFYDFNITNNLSQVFFKNLPDWQDNVNARSFLGIKCMLAVVANKYFDNPYRPFNIKSDFNGDPKLIGYYALGMHLFGIAKWLLEDTMSKGYDKIVFMARDGYFPMKAYDILKEVYKNAPKSQYLYVSRKALIPVTLINFMDFYKLSEVINICRHTPRSFIKYINDIVDNENNELDMLCKDNNILIDREFKDINEFNRYITLIIGKLYNKKKHQEKLKVIKEYFNDIYSGKSCTFDVGYSARPELFISDLCKKKIDTYFVNINEEVAYKHANIGGFDLNTFFDYKPAITGTIREMLISKSAPSCIGYDCNNNSIKPIFEDYSQSYQENFILDKIQSSSLEFVRDLVDIFKEDIDRLYYQKYYISLPHEMYIHSPKEFDKQVMNCIYFEDSVGLGNNVKLIDQWSQEMIWHNQQENSKLFDIEEVKEVKEIIIKEERNIDLEHRSKIIRLIYYMFFDRVTLREKVKYKFRKHKIIKFLLSIVYKTCRKTRNIFYAIVHAIK